MENPEIGATPSQEEPPEREAAALRLADLHEVNERLLISGLREQELAEALEAERAQLAVILAGIGDAVMVVDQERRIVRANAAYARLAGGADAFLAPEDEQGRPLPPDETPRARAARGEMFNLEFTLPTADGIRRWFEANGQPLGAPGVGHGVVVIRDITQSTQHRRLQNEFLDLAGHELRTPLTSVQGCLELLAKWLKDADDARVSRTIIMAQSQVRRLAVLVNDLMDVSRLQSGKLTLTRAVIDWRVPAAETVETARRLAEERTITFDAPDEPLLIYGDAGRLDQLLLNLLSNALKYTPSTARIEVGLRRVGKEAVLTVHDDGPGMATEVLPHLFERFYQVERADRGSQGGMGLGLFICHQLVEAHDGRLTVTSLEGEGTTFTAALPLLR